MGLDRSYASASDDDVPRGYGGAVVSASLDSDLSFHMHSPMHANKAQRGTSPRSRRHASSPDASLDELIDSFRASASSLQFSTATRSVRSPRTKRPLSPQKDQRGTDVHGLSPMPKLSYVPKPKPTLSMPAPSKPMATRGNHIKPPSKLQFPRSTVPKETVPKVSRSKFSSPTPTRARKNETTPSPPPSLSLSDQSTKSSVLEEIDAPDSDDAGELSVDDLISRDLRHLQRLVSSSHEALHLPDQRTPKNRLVTNEDVQREFRRSTRFRVDSDDGDEPMSSFRLYSPHARPASASSLRMEPIRSLLHSYNAADEDVEQEQDEDSFTKELKSKAAKERDRRNGEKAAEARQKREDAEKKKGADVPGANLVSLRDAVDAIDKNLLLALRPFEQMKKEQDKQDAAAAKEEENSMTQLELPMATQALVDQLEQVFGGMTREREADLKVDEERAAQAKEAEEKKKKDEVEKLAVVEAERKKQEEEILSLLPMRGKLMNTEDDIHDALIRLEIAETLAQNSRGHLPRGLLAQSSLAQNVANLREFTTRRAREIDDMLVATTQDAVHIPRAVDWHRRTFHMDGDDVPEIEADDEDTQLEYEEGSYSDVVKSEVLEKLDFTMLKLRHALSIDQKEATETRARQREIEAKAAADEKRKAEEKRAQEQVESDAAAARQRVMGISSTQELLWVAEADRRLQHSTRDSATLQRLQKSLESQQVSEHATRALPSFFDEALAAERFDTMKNMMETPYLLSLQRPHFMNQEPQRARRSRWNVDEKTSLSHERDRQTYAIHRERHQTIAPIEKDLWQPRTWTNPDNQREDGSASGWSSRPASISEEIGRRHIQKISVKPPSRRDENLVAMKRAIYELQADRREKAQRFHASTRSR